MSLKGIKILIDGWHLIQSKGSGVTTYSRTLLDALRSLDADVSILCNLNMKKVADARLQFAMFVAKLNLDSELTGDRARISLRKPWSILNILLSANRLIKCEPCSSAELPDEHKYLTPPLTIYNHDRFFYLGRFLMKRLKTSYHLVSLSGKFDIFHVTYPMPVHIPRVKRVTTIHDLIPVKLPELAPMNLYEFNTLLKDCLKKSSLIFTVSETSKRDILEFYDFDPDKIVVTFQPFDAQLVRMLELEANSWNTGIEEFVTNRVNNFSLSYRNYILFVGTLEPKKNVKRILEAYVKIDVPIPLVIVGKKGWLFEEIFLFHERLPEMLKKRIIFLDYVSRADLTCLFAGALCFVFPSLYEGFGLPPLEAMSLGCPVITSNLSSLPEVCGDAAIYVDPYSVSSIANGIAKVIDNPELREKLIQKGKDQVEYFSIKNYQDRLLNAYKML